MTDIRQAFAGGRHALCAARRGGHAWRSATRGVTLMELIMVMLMVGILASVSAVFLVRAIDIWQAQSSWEHNVTEGRRALDWMVREIRQIQDSSGLTTADVDEIVFTKGNGDTVHFQLSGTNVLHDSEILFDNASGLTFEYFNEANTELTTVPLSESNRQTVWSIQVTLTVPMAVPGGGEQDVAMTSRVLPRSLQFEESS